MTDVSCKVRSGDIGGSDIPVDRSGISSARFARVCGFITSLSVMVASMTMTTRTQKHSPEEDLIDLDTFGQLAHSRFPGESTELGCGERSESAWQIVDQEE